MRHRVARRKLGRKTEHRIATLRNLSSALIAHERVETTMGKAKELRSFAERLITRARTDTIHARRLVARRLHDTQELRLTKKLFDEIAPRFLARPGGYTRIIRTAARRGDNAEMAIVELVVRKETAPEKAAETAKGKGKKAVAEKPAAAAKPAKGEKPQKAAKAERPEKPAAKAKLKKVKQPRPSAETSRRRFTGRKSDMKPKHEKGGDR